MRKMHPVWELKSWQLQDVLFPKRFSTSTMCDSIVNAHNVKT